MVQQAGAASARLSPTMATSLAVGAQLTSDPSAFGISSQCHFNFCWCGENPC